MKNLENMKSVFRRDEVRFSEEALQKYDKLFEIGGFWSIPEERKIEEEYIKENNSDSKKKVVLNEHEESIFQIDLLKEKINEKDYKSLKQEITDMEEDNNIVLVTLVKIEENENELKAVVEILNESTQIKSYKVFDSR